MAEPKTVINVFGWIIWWGFLVTKIMGHTFALWSWWWLLLPIVPVLGEVVHRFNL